ncbi:hypothetical protein [Microbacterium sp. SS28]|uniref:hypothetical protein n=1 Tax=Microbacterium sp. SS28 TaxID=2919948 RepID=UPI001FAA5158|nr:hypothetical protein [Microbacterium sp. SS28]
MLFAVAAAIFGVIALIRKQPFGYALTGLILGAVALIVAVLITVGFTAFVGGRSAQSGRRSIPPVTTTPEDPPPQETKGGMPHRRLHPSQS